MPLPRYQPLRKRPKVASPTIDALDDNCLAQIIGYVLQSSSLRDGELSMSDNGKAERNLSLVSRRWYYLTQAQARVHGVCKINLDKLTPKVMPQKPIVNNLPYGSVSKRPGVLMQKQMSSIKSSNRAEQNATEAPGIRLFRAIQPKLLKYKSVILEGSLTCNEFKHLVVAMDASRVEFARLKIKITKDITRLADVATTPRLLPHLKRLSLHWSNNPESLFSNKVTWTILERASQLTALEICLDEPDLDQDPTSVQDEVKFSCFNSSDLLKRPISILHRKLNKIVFNRESNEHALDCIYTRIVQALLIQEKSVHHVDTNDGTLVEDLIKSSSRLSTANELTYLKFNSPIRNMNLLSQLINSNNLGTDNLSIVVDSIDQLDSIRNELANFPLGRREGAICELDLHIKDKKFPDCEDKIKNLVQLSRQTDMTIHITTHQRVSIDCCHLMWSVGRALNSSMDGKCLFKLNIQTHPPRRIANDFTEITIPFGSCQNYKINPKREDLARHREIMKALKRDCYHQFVKSVRDNITPREDLYFKMDVK